MCLRNSNICMCKKQTSVSHTDLLNLKLFLWMQVLRMDGFPLWDLVVEALHSCLNQPSILGKLCRNPTEKILS